MKSGQPGAQVLDQGLAGLMLQRLKSGSTDLDRQGEDGELALRAPGAAMSGEPTSLSSQP